MKSNREKSRKGSFVLVNDQINHDRLIVIDNNGDNLGVINKKDALKKASENGLDLVMVNCPRNDHPTCKIIDYGKYKYKQAIKNKKKPKQSKRKEIFLSINIGEHDKNTKLKKVVNFLDKKMEVVVGIKLKGRYRNKLDLAKSKLIEALRSINIDIDDNNWRESKWSVAVLIIPK